MVEVVIMVEICMNSLRPGIATRLNASQRSRVGAGMNRSEGEQSEV